MEQRIKYGSALLLMLIMILALYGYFHYKTEDSSLLLDRSTASISAQSLIRIAATDDTGFAKKYLYKVITVTGIIQDIRMRPTNVFNITLGASRVNPSSPSRTTDSDILIDCILDSTYNKHRPDWQPGDSCTIQGTCAGQLKNIILVDCIVITTTRK